MTCDRGNDTLTCAIRPAFYLHATQPGPTTTNNGALVCHRHISWAVRQHEQWHPDSPIHIKSRPTPKDTR